ncbi:MAG: hypothetical protein LBE13_18890 [Bacteroidales bacterium]|jgi:hypothetical protein|nr:hypothetical protein [Bacteroidales bacterium]
MKKIILLASIWSIALTVNAQQIGNGAATVIDTFNTLLPSGVYISNKVQPNYPLEVSAWPWKYLLVARSSVSSCEFQISSTFLHDDRAFFRKVVKDNNNPACNNSWYELATRGKNVFTDDQFLPFSKSIILGSSGTQSKRLRLQFIGNETQGDSYIDYGGSLYFRATSGSEYSYPVIGFTPIGNVMIGLPNATVKKKLTVYGSIVAEEVLVKSNVWADFVFNDDYRLKPLSEVNTFIKETNTCRRYLPLRK